MDGSPGRCASGQRGDESDRQPRGRGLVSDIVEVAMTLMCTVLLWWMILIVGDSSDHRVRFANSSSGRSSGGGSRGGSSGGSGRKVSSMKIRNKRSSDSNGNGTKNAGGRCLMIETRNDGPPIKFEEDTPPATPIVELATTAAASGHDTSAVERYLPGPNSISPNRPLNSSDQVVVTSKLGQSTNSSPPPSPPTVNLGNNNNNNDNGRDFVAVPDSTARLLDHCVRVDDISPPAPRNLVGGETEPDIELRYLPSSTPYWIIEQPIGSRSSIVEPINSSETSSADEQVIEKYRRISKSNNTPGSGNNSPRRYVAVKRTIDTCSRDPDDSHTYYVSSGDIDVQGEDISDLQPRTRPSQGVSITFVPDTSLRGYNDEDVDLEDMATNDNGGYFSDSSSIESLVNANIRFCKEDDVNIDSIEFLQPDDKLDVSQEFTESDSDGIVCYSNGVSTTTPLYRHLKHRSPADGSSDVTDHVIKRGVIEIPSNNSNHSNNGCIETRLFVPILTSTPIKHSEANSEESDLNNDKLVMLCKYTI